MPHPLFQPPAAEAKIWRYTDLAKFLAMLETRSLYFCNLIALADSDPYEGHYPDNQVEAFAYLKNLPTDQIKAALNMDPSVTDDHVRWICDQNLRTARGQSSHRGCIYVNCWHINEAESDAMWRLYTLQGQGIAVQSTYDRLVRSLHMSVPHVSVGKVGYFDYKNHVIGLDNLFGPALNKRASFQHENELRAATLNMTRYYQEAIGPDRWPIDFADHADGYPIEVDLDLLIERVVVSPKSPSWIVDLVGDVLKRYGIDKPIDWSPLYTRSSF